MDSALRPYRRGGTPNPERSNIMARYIFIESNSGYIFGDSADLKGITSDSSLQEIAAAIDAEAGEFGRTYDVLSRNPRTTESGYDVWRVDVGGSEVVPVVRDGQDQEMIDAVESEGEYAGFVAIRS